MIVKRGVQVDQALAGARSKYKPASYGFATTADSKIYYKGGLIKGKPLSDLPVGMLGVGRAEGF